MESTAPAVVEQVQTRQVAGAHRSLWQLILPYLLIAPTFILVFMFTIWPATQTVIDSTYEPGRARTDTPEYVGLQNYRDLFDSTHYLGSRFTRIFTNTLIFTGATVFISIPLALLMAILVNRRILARPLWRFALFYPSLLPLIGAASIWAFLYSDSVGLINTVLRSFGLSGVNWIGDPNTVLGSVTAVNIWKQTGYYMIFYLAGLQGIPREMYEAAELSGANMWQQFRYVTLPYLRRTTLFILVVASIFGFQTVEQLQVLNRGLPGDRGNLILYFIFQNIGERRNLGYINAVTVILVALLLGFTITNFYLFERGERAHD
jgi:sn-glycerol 3-phosphate transport system permease protein